MFLCITSEEVYSQQINAALDFDGIDDFVLVPHASKLDFELPFTLEVWFKTDFNGNQTILDKSTRSSKGYRLAIISGGIVRFEIDGGPSWDAYQTFGGGFADGSWHHFAFTARPFAQNNNPNIYIDGQSSFSSVTLGLPIYVPSSDNMHIGQNNDTTNQFTGQLDEIRIWYRELTLSEVQSNMNLELNGNEPGLVAYYKLNEGTHYANNVANSNAYDVTCNANHGMIINFALTDSSSNYVPGPVLNPPPSMACASPNGLFANKLNPTAARLNWVAVYTGLAYQMRGRLVGNTPWKYIFVPGPDTDSLNVSQLGSQNNYEWQLRTFCCNDDTSAWSLLDTFTTGCYPPDTTFTNPIISNAAQFNWQQRPSADGYHIQGRLFGNTNWVNLFVPQGSSKQIFGLQASTSYEWRLRTICNQGNNVYSPWSGIVGFTTANFGSNRHPEGGTTEGSGWLLQHNPTGSFSREMRDQDDGIDWASAEEQLLVFPNPFNTTTTIQLPATFSSNRILLYDLRGAVVIDFISTETAVQMDCEDLTSGVYLLEVHTGEQVWREKLVVE